MFEMSSRTQNIRVFNLRADTKEFISAGDAYIPPYTGLPANCTTVSPPEIPAGYAAVFDSAGETWVFVEDHRDQTFYDKETGRAVYISELGVLPDNLVNTAPDGDFMKWDGEQWVKDTEAENAAKLAAATQEQKRLLSVAAQKIAVYQDAVDLEMATVEDKAALLAWKKYRVLLSRVDLADPEWPEQPQ